MADKEHLAELNRIRVLRHYENKKAQGFSKFTVFCHVDDRPEILDFAKNLRNKREGKD